MTFVNVAGRVAAVLVLSFAERALADGAFAVAAAADGAVDPARQCDVYVAGVATGRPGAPLRYRWLDDGVPLAAWTDVRADGTAPLELCGLAPGRHALTVEVTDGARTASDTMTATIAAAPALIARGEPAGAR
jgi:hypothetical protein